MTWDQSANIAFSVCLPFLGREFSSRGGEGNRLLHTLLLRELGKDCPCRLVWMKIWALVARPKFADFCKDLC